jgi:hypothetical protein
VRQGERRKAEAKALGPGCGPNATSNAIVVDDRPSSGLGWEKGRKALQPCTTV